MLISLCHFDEPPLKPKALCWTSEGNGPMMGPPEAHGAPGSLSPMPPLSEALMPSLVTVLHFCISLSRTCFLLMSYSHSHGHFLVLATQKCLRPDPRMPCYGMNCFSVLLFVPAPPKILAEITRTIYTTFCSLYRIRAFTQ